MAKSVILMTDLEIWLLIVLQMIKTAIGTISIQMALPWLVSKPLMVRLITLAKMVSKSKVKLLQTMVS